MAWFILAAVVVLLAVVSFIVIRDRPGYRPADHGPAIPRTPGDWKKIYLSARVWHLGIVYFMFGFAYMAYMTFFTKRLIADVGYTPEGAGTMFMILGWASLVCGVLWGSIADAIGRKWAMVAILFIQSVAYALFARLDGSHRHSRLGGALRDHRLGYPGDHGSRVRRHRGTVDGSGGVRFPHSVPRLRAGSRPVRGRAGWPTRCQPSPPAT